MYFQQGDVLAKKIKELPQGLNIVNGNLIHKGRDHHHLIDGDFSLYAVGDDFYIEARGICRLTHPEHKDIDLPAGLYRKDIVMEYDHLAEDSRRVID